MEKCFIFINDWRASSFKSLVLDKEENITVALQDLKINELERFQHNRQTILILSAQLVGIYKIPLPKINANKAKLAITCALEEELPLSLTDYYFAFNPKTYQNGCYSTIVVNRHELAALISLFNKHKVNISQITIDWCLTDNNCAYVLGTQILVNSLKFSGAITTDLLAAFLNQEEFTQLKFLAFNDSLNLELANISKTNATWFDWLAKKYSKSLIINLLQTEFKNNKDQQSSFYYKLAFGCFCSWLVMFLLAKSIFLFQLNHKLTIVDNEIANIYRQFFPNDNQIIPAQIRFKSLINTHKNKSKIFWLLWDAVAKIVINEKNIKIKSFNYTNNKLQLTATMPNFANLAQLIANFEKLKVQVKQQNAVTHKDKVLCSLELSL